MQNQDSSEMLEKSNDQKKEMEGGVWGIVIIISAFMLQVFVFGATAGIGVFNIELLEYFDNDTVGVSLIAAMNFAFFLGSGPIISLMMTKMSFRKIALLGSVLVTIGLLGMPLLPYIPSMCIFYGILAGFGSNCLYMPSHILSGLYYDKYRSMATGIATSGSGLGCAIMPVVIGALIDFYTWKGAFVVYAGICLHCFIFSALLRPPPTLPSNEEVDPSDPSKRAALTADCSQRPLLPEGTADVSFKPQNGDNENADRNNQELSVISLPSEKLTERLEKEVPKTSKHIYVFTSSGFCIYFFNNLLWNISNSIIQSFGPDFLTHRGLMPMEAAWLYGAFGLGCFIGGITGGIGGNFKCVNRIFLFSGADIIMGLFFLLMPMFSSMLMYAVALAIAGLSFGIVLGLLIVVLTDLIGVESLSNGLGYLMLANGIGTFIGPPIAGAMQRSFGRWDEAIYLAGILSILSGIVMCAVPFTSCISKRQKRTL